MRARAAVIMLACACRAGAIVGGVEPAESSYDAVGAFAVAWRLGLEASPDPAAGPHNWYCSATLSAPGIVHTARHCIDAYGPAAPHAVRFRRALDGSIGTPEAGPASYYHAMVGGWVFADDVAVGYLMSEVPHIAPIQVLGDDTAAVYRGAPIIVAGWGREGPDPAQGRLRSLRACATVVWSAYEVGMIFPTAWQAPRGVACGPNTGDSGGAVLATVGDGKAGRLALVGVTAGLGVASRLSAYTHSPISAARTRSASRRLR